MSYFKSKKPKNYLSIFSYISTFVPLFLLFFAVFGYKYEIFSIQFSLLTLTKYGVYASIFALGLNLIILGIILNKNGKFVSIAFVVISLILNIFIISYFYKSTIALKSNPKINDISTNYEDVINYKVYQSHDSHNEEYELVQKFGGFNKPNYNLSSLLINNKTHVQVFNESKNILLQMGLNITYSNLEEGIIEAVDESFWYGFKDDMIIRIEKLISDAIKIDARSASRKGKSDFGVNSRRIIGFFELLNTSLRN